MRMSRPPLLFSAEETSIVGDNWDMGGVQELASNGQESVDGAMKLHLSRFERHQNHHLVSFTIQVLIHNKTQHLALKT